jgi:hypothetical protein
VSDDGDDAGVGERHRIGDAAVEDAFAVDVGGRAVTDVRDGEEFPRVGDVPHPLLGDPRVRTTDGDDGRVLGVTDRVELRLVDAGDVAVVPSQEVVENPLGTLWSLVAHTRSITAVRHSGLEMYRPACQPLPALCRVAGSRRPCVVGCSRRSREPTTTSTGRRRVSPSTPAPSRGRVVSDSPHGPAAAEAVGVKV